MSEDLSPPATLATVVTKYRESMAGCLQASLVGINDVLSPIDLDGVFGPISQSEFDDDPVIVFRQMSYLLMTKARLHVFAAVRANRESNIHSLAVQVRPALECAGQVVSVFRDLLGKFPGAEGRIIGYANADYYQTVIRLSRGQVDHIEILSKINAAVPSRTEPVRKVRSLRESEKVKDLAFGENWYGHLSDCFFHSDMAALKNDSYFGGVRSNNTMHDEFGFALLLDYFAHQMMVMVLYAAACPNDSVEEDERFENDRGTVEEEKDGFREFPKEALIDGRSKEVGKAGPCGSAMRGVETREDAVDRLRSGCEQCLSCLKELSRVQLEMDPHDRAIAAADDEMVYRLRKVLLHVKAITGWHLDTEVIHVQAPELRAADEQIGQIWKKVPRDELSEYLARDGKTVEAGRVTMFKAGKEILSSYVHPTPQRLLLGKELGGLGQTDEVRFFANLAHVVVWTGVSIRSFTGPHVAALKRWKREISSGGDVEGDGSNGLYFDGGLPSICYSE